MKKSISIEGMSCQHCTKHVTDALKGVAGVKKAKVNLEKKSAVVSGEFSDDAIRKAIADAGYTVTGITGD